MKKLALLLSLALPAAASAEEEDAVSVDERRREDDEGPAPAGARFSGDVRFRARETRPYGSTYREAPPELQHNVYLYQRTRLAWGPASGGFLVKRAAVGPSFTYGHLRDYGTLKASVAWEDQGPLRRAVAGNYTLAFGQGLVFYDAFGEFVRPVKVRDAGPKADWGTSASEGLKGGAARFGGEVGTLDLFVSQKALDAKLAPDGTVDGDIDALRDDAGDVQSRTALNRHAALTEKIAGGRLAAVLGQAKLGVSGYQARYSRPFAPLDRDFADARDFRGDRLAMFGLDADVALGDWSIFGEAAASRPSGPDANPGGRAWTAGALHRADRLRWWLAFFDYDPDFISPHGKALSFAVSGGAEALPRNQKGAQWGGEFSRGPWRGRVNATFTRFPEALGDGTTSSPVLPSEGTYLLWDQTYDFGKGTEARLSLSERALQKRLADPLTEVHRQVEEKVSRVRAGLKWKATPRLTWEVRHDARVERVRAYKERNSGRLWMLDAAWANARTALKMRTYFFRSPEAFLSTGAEEIWDGVTYPRLAGNGGSLRGDPGTRTYLIWRRRVTDQGRLWVKAEVTRRGEAVPRRAWHMQWEQSWGK